MPARSPRRRPGAEAPEPPDAAAAMEIAVRFLGARPRTRWEISRRLERAGVREEISQATLDRLAQLGYVDDLAFARWWAEQRDRHAPRGRRMLEAELRRQGVRSETIDEFRAHHAAPERLPEDVDLPGTEAERARDALDRHLRGRVMPTDRRAVQRIGMFLMRRGFDPETVRSTLRAAADETADPEEAGPEG